MLVHIHATECQAKGALKALSLQPHVALWELTSRDGMKVVGHSIFWDASPSTRQEAKD